MSYKIKRGGIGWHLSVTHPSVISSADNFEIKMTERQERKATMYIELFKFVARNTCLAITELWKTRLKSEEVIQIGHMYRDPRTTDRLIKAGVPAAKNSKHHDWEAMDVYFYKAKGKRIRDRALFSKVAKYIAEEYGFLFSEIIVYDWGVHLGFVSTKDLERGKKKYWRLD
jgi:hypothetical protein